MNDYELLDIIGEANERYVLEAQKYRSGSRSAKPAVRPVRRVLLIAAIVALLVAMVGFAAIVFDLDSLLLGTFGQEQPSDYISLQGYTGSKNYLAAQEWQEFLDSYDPDGSLLEEARETGYTAPVAYEAYMCYTDEMVSKVEEICWKYGLNPLGALHMEKDAVSTLDVVCVNSVFAHPEALQVLASEGYWFVDGSFSLSYLEFCLSDSSWEYPLETQYRCVMKTSFDGVYINVWNVDAYDQWTYTNAEGTQLLLALSETHALIAADMEDYFATLSILNPGVGEEKMDWAGLESVADALTFDYVPRSLESQYENITPVAYTPGYELFEGVFLPVAEGACGDALDEVSAVLTQLGYEYRLVEGMLSVEDEKTGKWLSATLTNQNVMVELADLTYCHVEGGREYRVKVNLHTGTPEYYIEDSQPPFAETPVQTLDELKQYIYNCE